MNVLTFRQKFAALFSIALMTGLAIYLCSGNMLFVSANIFNGPSYFISTFIYLIPVAATVPFIVFGMLSVISLARSVTDERKTEKAKRLAKTELIIGISYFALFLILIAIFGGPYEFGYSYMPLFVFQNMFFYISGLVLSIAVSVFLLLPMKNPAADAPPEAASEMQMPKRNHNLFPPVIIAFISGLVLNYVFGDIFFYVINSIPNMLNNPYVDGYYIFSDILTILLWVTSLGCAGAIITLIVFYMLPRPEKNDRIIKRLIFITLITVIVICGFEIMRYIIMCAANADDDSLYPLMAAVAYFPTGFIAALALSIIVLVTSNKERGHATRYNP